MSVAPRAECRLHAVCRVDELPPGERRMTTIRGLSIGVFNVAGDYRAILNRCPHAGAPLCVGRVTGMANACGPGYDIEWQRDGELIRCPWHAWEFDLLTGRSVSDPRVRVRTFPVHVRDGEILVETRR